MLPQKNADDMSSDSAHEIYSDTLNPSKRLRISNVGQDMLIDFIIESELKMNFDQCIKDGLISNNRSLLHIQLEKYDIVLNRKHIDKYQKEAICFNVIDVHRDEDIIEVAIFDTYTVNMKNDQLHSNVVVDSSGKLKVQSLIPGVAEAPIHPRSRSNSLKNRNF